MITRILLGIFLLAQVAAAATSPNCAQLPNVACANSAQTATQTITTNLNIGGNDGLNFTAITAPTCSAGMYKIYVDTATSKLKKCDNGSASDLGAGSGTVTWDAISNPAGAQTLSMAANNTSWNFTTGLLALTWNGNNSTNALMSLKDTTGNTGTGPIFETHSVSTSAKPFQATAQGTSNGVQMSTAGVLAKLGTGSNVADNIIFGSDARGDLSVRGALVYGRLALGSSGTFLRSNGTDPVYANISSTDIGPGDLANVLVWTETPGGTSPNITITTAPRTTDSLLLVVNGIVQTRVASCGGTNANEYSISSNAITQCFTDTSAKIRAYYEL